MELNDKIIAKLQENNPGRTFQLLARVDPISYTPRILLTVDGRETQYGYYPSLYEQFRKDHNWTDEQLVEHFVAGAKGLLFL